MDSLSRRNWAAIWLLGFTAILAIQAVWELLDESLPVWDMAYHQLQGWRYLAAWQEGRFFDQFSALSTYYPPLYYLQEAVVLRLFPGTQFLALLSNLLGMLLLSFCSYRLAGLFMKPAAAVATGLLPLLFPLVVWTSRVSLLDLPLGGWVAASGYLLVKSNSLRSRSWALAFGLCCAAGSLTKWTFVLFLLLPLAHTLIYSPHRKTSLIHLALATLVAVPFVVLWYLPNLDSLIERFQITAQAAVGEGDPGWDDILGWIYYPRSLASYYLYFPLTAVGVWGAIRMGRPGQQTQQRFLQFLWWWLVGGLLFMMLLPAKVEAKEFLGCRDPFAGLFAVSQCVLSHRTSKDCPVRPDRGHRLSECSTGVGTLSDPLFRHIRPSNTGGLENRADTRSGRFGRTSRFSSRCGPVQSGHL